MAMWVTGANTGIDVDWTTCIPGSDIGASGRERESSPTLGPVLVTI